MLRRCITILLTVIMIGACAGCGDKAVSKSEEKSSEPPKPKIETVQNGSVVKSKSAEITINKVSLSYDVLPDKTDGFYTHYPADKGNVYIDVDVNVKNVQKQNLKCDSIVNIEADYNGGYQYSAMPVVKDSGSGFTYANITTIKPLETRGMKYLIKCPEEVESSKNPLFLTITLDGKKYKYVIRE